MIFLCDAMNIMYKIDTISDILNRPKSNLIDARREFIQVINFFSIHYKRNKKHFFNIFFDGGEVNLGIEASKNIQFHYSYGEKVADHEIYDFIKDYNIKQDLCVVSSDGEIKKYSIRKKCEYWSSEKFVELYTKLYLDYKKDKNSIIQEKINTESEKLIFENKKKDKKYLNLNFMPRGKKYIAKNQIKIEKIEKVDRNNKNLKKDNIDEYSNLFKNQQRDKKYQTKREPIALPSKKKENRFILNNFKIDKTYLKKNLDDSLKNPDTNPNVKLNSKQIDFYLKMFQSNRK